MTVRPLDPAVIATDRGADRPTSAEDILDLLDAIRPAWHAQAACRGQTDVMFPVAERGHRLDTSAARALCARCLVQTECADAGRTEPHGVWGGTRRHHRNDDSRGPTQRAVLEALTDGQWWTAMDVAAWLSVSDVSARKALGRLRDLDIVEMTDSRPYRYRLREAS